MSTQLQVCLLRTDVELGRSTRPSPWLIPLGARVAVAVAGPAHAIGAIGLFGTESGPLPAADLRAGQALADMAAIGILHERTLARSEVLNEQLQAL